MNDHVGKINLDELYTRKKEIHDNKLKIYNMILKRVHDRIKYTSRLKDSHCFCCYVIPEFLLGVPRYDSAACTAYLIDQLQENGFAIKYTHPNLLFISWKNKTNNNMLKIENKKNEPSNKTQLKMGKVDLVGITLFIF